MLSSSMILKASSIISCTGRAGAECSRGGREGWGLWLKDASSKGFRDEDRRVMGSSSLAAVVRLLDMIVRKAMDGSRTTKVVASVNRVYQRNARALRL